MRGSSPKSRIVYTFEGFRFDVGERSVRTPDGEDHPLKPKAFETLLYLVSNPGRVIERDEIMAAVWPDTVVEENNLTQHISFLRRLLGDTPDYHRFIETVPGRGYRFAAVVRKEEPEADIAAVLRGGERSVLLQRKWFLIIAAGVIASLVLGSLYQFEPSRSADGSIRSIAVLPFKPLSDENRDRALGRGMADALIAKLGSAKGIKVLPFAAVNRFDSPDQDAIEVGRELGVDAVLDSTIQISERRVGVRVKLISVATSEQLWEDPFDDELTDFISVQESITERVANRLRVELSENARKRYTENPLAYRLYLTGRAHQLKLIRSEVERAIDNYQRAIDVDPDYALAYTGLSDCYRSLILSVQSPPGENIGPAISAAEKAVKIDPTLAEAQANLGTNYFWLKRDWVASEAAFRRALDIDPNSAFAHLHYSHLLSNLGRHEDAIVHAEEARKLDPFSAYSLAIQGMVYHQAEKLDVAFARFDEATKLDPNVWLTHLYAATAYADLQKYGDAITAAQTASALNPSQTISIAYESLALARSGRRDEAKKLLDSLLKRSEEGYVPPYHIALAYMGLGDRENALQWLEKSVSEQDPKIVFLKTHHAWDGIRKEPRFIELMRKMRLE